MAKIERLLEIMVRLRDPDSGCPWDLEQDFSSISPFTLEEAYEVDEAIASGEPDAIRDELGDLLFQVVFQSRIAQELGLFDFDEVTQGICDKLIRRHPHVFAESAAPESIKAQSRSWEAIKAEEREKKAEGRDSDPFEGIPRRLPALSRSAKVASRVEGMASVRVEGTKGGLEGSLAAAAAASEVVRSASQSASSRESLRACVGEGLRSWVRVARVLGVDAEQALREADDAEIEAVRSRSADLSSDGIEPAQDPHQESS